MDRHRKSYDPKGILPPGSSHSNHLQPDKSDSRTRLDKLLSFDGNKLCADCGSPDPKWVHLSIVFIAIIGNNKRNHINPLLPLVLCISISFGVFICIKCSGAHRSLGVHVSKVLSAKLDEWTDEQVHMLEEMGGNNVANMKYEANIPESVKKPNPDYSSEERSDYIRKKYELQQFIFSEEAAACPFPPPNRNAPSSQSNNNSTQEKKSIEKQGTTTKHRIGFKFRNSWGRKDAQHKGAKKKSSSTVGMVEFVGLIKVNVVKGTNLVVRDMISSDPYVVLALGHQKVRTRVIKNNLNPVWNESLMLSIPENIPPLKLLVYDKDRFSTDDFMGEAEIDIQPLVSAAKAFENSSMEETAQLGKWEASKDNSLVKDSVITMVDGEVKQEVYIKLQNVERGEIDIELHCVPLTQ